MGTPPLGYSTPLRPESLQETYQNQIVDKAISVCKSAVQQYIESFLSPGGINRNYLKATVSPEGLQYVTELTYDDEMKVKPNLRKTKLARFFAENTGKLPSILIIDQGVESENVGINSMIEGFSFENQWRGTVVFVGRISLSISVATYSEEDTTTLSQLVLYMFDTLSDAVNNKLIRNKANKWEIRLPMAGITAGSLTNFSVDGDNKTQVWTRSVEVQLEIETHASVKLPTPTYILGEGTIGAPQGEPSPKVMNLAANQAISLGSQYPLVVVNLRTHQYLATSDPNIVTVTDEPPFTLMPRRAGKALLYILDRTLDCSQDLTTGKKKNLILDIPFRVTV
jgi:hypothetical protein